MQNSDRVRAGAGGGGSGSSGSAGRPWYAPSGHSARPAADPRERGSASVSAAAGEAWRPTSIARDRARPPPQPGTTMSSIVLHRIDGASATDVERAVQFLLRATEPDGAIEALSAGSEAVADILFRRSVEEATRNGQCDMAYVDGKPAGIAVWNAPGVDYRFHEDPAILRNVPEDILEWYTAHYAIRWEELYVSAGAASSTIRREAWKMLWMVILPEYHSRGIKKALLDVIAQKADRDRRRVLAEVRNPDSVNRFLNAGYQYRAVKNMSCGKFIGFPVWLLIRDPVPHESVSVKPERD